MLGGIGKIYLYPHKQEVHYAITKKGELIRIINLIFPVYNLLTSYLLQWFLVRQKEKVLLDGITITFFPTLELFKELNSETLPQFRYLFNNV
jgi:hypothetical protein